jgi:thioesterase domain-containing protein
MSRDSRYLESVLHHDIPLTREMGLKVLDWQEQQLRLHLPLEPTSIHKSTMFGGSLYCGAVLAGWGWLHSAPERRRHRRRAYRDSGRADQLSAAGDR